LQVEIGQRECVRVLGEMFRRALILFYIASLT